jgi:hypothetical protein
MPLVPHTPPAAAEEHAALVVALDAGDLGGPERVRAETLVASCGGCAALLADLVAIRGAMTSLPLPPRRRDFRLTDADVARLRPSPWRRLAGWLAGPRSSVRPLATGLASLGIVGLLLTAGLPGLGWGAGAALAPADGGVRTSDTESVGASAAPLYQPGEAPAPEATEGPAATGAPAATMGPAALPGGDPGQAGTAGDTGSPGPTDERNATSEDGSTAGGEAQGEDTFKATDRGGGIPAGVVVSAVLLLAGLGLFAVRAIALRRA